MPRAKQSMDGNTAAAHVAYAFTDVAAIYPITPSSPMADTVDQWSAAGLKNIFGNQVKVVEMESEAGAAGAVHGSLGTGAITTTFTASQGLLLMIPNMYKIAAEQLPCVFDVSARTVATQALNIFGDHSDVMAVRQTGFAMLCESNPQEVMDLSPVAHLSAIEGHVPFVNFFDGFRTSHEIQKVAVWDYEDLKDMCDMDAVKAFRERALNPSHPTMRGSHENGDIFFQNREASNKYYDAIPEIVEEYMGKVNEKLGTDYKLFNYYGAEDAEKVIIAMGSVNDTIEETIDYLVAAGKKVGVVKVRLYRPFSAEALINAIPETVKQISVLDRTKEPGSLGEPLYLDVVAALKGSKFESTPVFTGRYGLGSKDTTPAQIVAVYENTEKQRFTIGIVDDVTNLSLPVGAPLVTTPEGTINCKFWGLGADGTVGANKNSIKIIGDNTDMYAQAYFDYDSKKSGGYTVSHLRIGAAPIRAPYLIGQADFLACHQPTLMNLDVVAQSVKPGGTVLLNLPDGMEIPAKLRRSIAKRHALLYAIDADAIAAQCGLGGRINTVMQTAFFQLNAFLPEKQRQQLLTESVQAAYAKKGERVVAANLNAIAKTADALRRVDVPPEWAKLPDTPEDTPQSAVEAFMRPMLRQQGDMLPVSAMDARGFAPLGTSRLEKRGIARQIPQWRAEACIQCGLCSLVCPHGCIRTFYPLAETAFPVDFHTVRAKGKAFSGRNFRVQVSPLDCTGCENCARTCPAKDKALVMRPAAEMAQEQANWNFAVSLPETAIGEADTIPLAQAKTPLFEFSGACAGCGETPYIKLLTQLFGSHLMIANATGCSSIYAGSAPSCPYTVNQKGQGVAWGNSLFEDNAEFGFGLYLAMKQRRAHLAEQVETLAAQCPELAESCRAWLGSREDTALSAQAGEALLAACETLSHPLVKEIADSADLLAAKSVWLIGGDGWAFDIGFGGLDHVLASGEKVRVLVLNTQVYSNTGGQASKATPAGAAARLMSGGKSGAEKDLGLMAMTYGHVYVAQVAMGANPNQLLKAMREAEAWDGAALIIAYAPCIAHGIDMRDVQEIEKKAVQCGYFPLYRYHPANGLMLDSKAPDGDFQAFLMRQGRFAALRRSDPAKSETLCKMAEEEARRRWNLLKMLKNREMP